MITNYIKPSLTNFSLKGEIHLSSIYQLISFLEDVSRGIHGDIIRMKGFIKIIDLIYHFEFTNGLYSLTESNIEDIKEDEIVFIGYKSINRK